MTTIKIENNIEELEGKQFKDEFELKRFIDNLVGKELKESEKAFDNTFISYFKSKKGKETVKKTEDIVDEILE